MSTINTIANNETKSTPRSSSHPETSKEQLSKAQIAMRIELRKSIETMTKATASDKLNEWEKSYLMDIITKFKTYGLATRLSLAQVMTMNRCVLKATLSA